MNRNGLQAVLRSVAGTCRTVPDAELLRRYVATRDEAAFADLVRRHGRLVWSVCRQLTNCDADADDAFQATFLVLVNGAGKVRDAGKLSAWLHGVAYKVCAKSRRAAKSRAGRESVAARGEGGVAVPDSAWDWALAAVHEEVARLPESLRVPFVLCCLEGKGASEAAEQLGWKLGTFSGRLTRAKDAVIARLDARGMTLAAIVAVAAPRDAPAAVVRKASVLCGRDFAVPGSILKLSQGVLGMSASRVKLLAVGLFVVCGLGAGGGTGWLSTAEAQSEPKSKVPAAQDKIKQLEEEIARLKQEAARADKPLRVAPPAPVIPPPPPAPVTSALPATPPQPPKVTVAAPVVRDVIIERSPASEFDYVLASEMTTTKFTAFLRERERVLRFFRFPYLNEGDTLAKVDAAREWLARTGQRNLSVTIDDQDWSYEEPWVKAERAGDAAALAQVAADYHAALQISVRHAEETGDRVLGRRTPQVLLLHANAVGAAQWDRLFTWLEETGHRFASADEVLADPVFGDLPRLAATNGFSLWDRIAALKREADAREGVRRLLDVQSQAWSRGDIETFCSTYAEDATYVSPSGLTRGRAEVLERYKNRYPGREAMGALTLDIVEMRPAWGIEVSLLDDAVPGRVQSVSVVARWKLVRTGQPDATGLTLIVLRPKGDGWEIVQDASM